MKRILPLILFLCSCSVLLPDGSTSSKSIPVEKAAEILRDLADKVERYDLDKDGAISGTEYIPFSLAVGARLYAELR